MSNIEVLIISSKHDYATDYVCFELNRRSKSYVRINRDSFCEYKVSFNIQEEELTMDTVSNRYVVNNKLKSVYYRAPIYFRETFMRKFSPEEQLYNSQWMAFIRNLTFFDNARWMNNPIDTFRAENKLLQLKYAKSVGFKIPNTIVTNNNAFHRIGDKMAIKAIDTALFKIDNKEAFFYTNILEEKEIRQFDINLCPIMAQNNLEPKIDYRITIAGQKIYSVAITENEHGVSGDWRKKKNTLKFVSCEVPNVIKKRCLELMDKFNLSFGGIDLIKYNDEFYFIEINPTGEWAWLVEAANQKVYEGISDYLI